MNRRALLDRAGGGGRGRGRGVSRGTARPARCEGDARAVAAVRGGGGAQEDPAGEGVDANDGKRPEFAVRSAPNHVASKLKVGIIAGTRAWYLLQISSELENDTRARRQKNRKSLR